MERALIGDNGFLRTKNIWLDDCLVPQLPYLCFVTLLREPPPPPAARARPPSAPPARPSPARCLPLQPEASSPSWTARSLFGGSHGCLHAIKQPTLSDPRCAATALTSSFCSHFTPLQPAAGLSTTACSSATPPASKPSTPRRSMPTWAPCRPGATAARWSTQTTGGSGPLMGRGRSLVGLVGQRTCC